jgi:NADPH2 dehydrogenase
MPVPIGPTGEKITGIAPTTAIFREGITPSSMTLEDISNIKLKFVDTSQRDREAGFDGVEVHSDHLYLLSQFLSLVTTKRTDRYGGDVRHRATLALEIVQDIRKSSIKTTLFFPASMRFKM